MNAQEDARGNNSEKFWRGCLGNVFDPGKNHFGNKSVLGKHKFEHFGIIEPLAALQSESVLA